MTKADSWPRNYPANLFWASQPAMHDDHAITAALRILAAAQRSPQPTADLHIVEIGCGRGEIAMALSELGFRVTAIDNDEARIHEAVAAQTLRGTSVTFLAADATRAIRLAPVDVAFCHYSGWGYQGLFDVLQMLRLVRGQLSADGCFVIETNDDDAVITNFQRELSFNRSSSTGDWNVRCSSELVHRCPNTGLGRIIQSWCYTGPDGSEHPQADAIYEPVGRKILAALCASAGFAPPVELQAGDEVRATPGGSRYLARLEPAALPYPSDLVAMMRGRWLQQRDEIALIDENANLTGRDLLDAATRLELALRQIPSVAASPIAVLLPRSAAWPIALLGIRAANAVFAPIDPDQPDERIAGMLERLRPSAILCFSEHAARFAALAATGGEALNIPAPGPQSEDTVLLPMGNARHFSEPVSHIFHTSGSTGRPKGVLLHEHGMLKVIEAQCVLLPPAPGISLWALGPGFDASLSDVLCPIMAGRTLQIHRPSPAMLRTFKSALKPGMVADIPPSMLPLLIDEVNRLSGVVFGGERASRDAVLDISRVPHAFQAYGPTEASICCMVAAPEEDWSPGLLGAPLIPDSILVLSEGKLHLAVQSRDWENVVQFQPRLKDGAEGELVIFGDIVAHGYLDEPELDEERFNSLGGGRNYLTGDLVRYSSGRLYWTGRKDRQVKINGRMICPEEIELVVAEIAKGKRNRVVIDGTKIRVFVQGTAPTGLGAKVARRLGATFRPASVHSVKEIPVGTSGKPDDAKLLELRK